MAKESHNRKKTPERQAFGLKVRMRRFEVGMTHEAFVEKAIRIRLMLDLLKEGKDQYKSKSFIGIAIGEWVIANVEIKIQAIFEAEGGGCLPSDQTRIIEAM